MAFGAIDTIVGENSKRITDAFNILGVMVVGARAANTIVLKTVAKIPLGGKLQPLQTVLDGIFPRFASFSLGHFGLVAGFK